jgi:hypothetical protein
MIEIDLGLLAGSPCHAVAYDMQTEMSSLPTGDCNYTKLGRDVQ